MNKSKIIFITILLYFIFTIIVVVCLQYYTVFSGWLSLLSLFLSGVLVLERILNAVLRILGEPRLKLVDSVRKPYNEDSEGEYMELYLTIKNIGGGQAIDCNIHAKAKNISKKPYLISRIPFSLDAGVTAEILFHQIIKSEQTTRSLFKNSPKLKRGEVYEYEIGFSGANFKDEKVHRLKLDLTSWENIRVIIDC